MIFIRNDALAQADKWFKDQAPKFPKTGPERFVPPGILPNIIDMEFSSIYSRRLFSQEEFMLMPRLNGYVVVVIRQDYLDAFGTRYWTDSCFSNFGDQAIPDCPEHNEIH
jgi:hypothetical protein